MDFDATGKVSLDHLYVQDDPRPYFAALRELDYVIPQLAKPYFAKLIGECRSARSVAVPTVVDVGCSYGVNAALLRCDVTIDELYEHYAGCAGLGRDALVRRDRALVRSSCDGDQARIVGLDSSVPALSYALDAGLVDAAVHADLEHHAATPVQRAELARADLVISTGCVGYVTERTIRQVADAAARARRPLPWMAHFVLRMFSYAEVAESLSELGYETVQRDGLFKQRRFASVREQAGVLDGLVAAGVDPEGLEADGWLYAELYVSIPSTSPRSPRTPRSSRGGSMTASDEPTPGTFDLEAQLPRVPVPTIEDSCRRFLEWCAPLLTADELVATTAAVDAFRAPGSPAHALQEELERYDVRPDVGSWLDAFWASRYLGRRDRIALNANFFFLFQDMGPGAGDGQVARAAGLIMAALGYKRQLDEERIAPVVQRGRAMTMEQNKFLFSTTRIPGEVQDTVRAPYSDEWPGPSPFRHVVVFYRGNAFRMDVLGSGVDGAPPAPYSLDDLADGLEAVMKAGDDRAPDGTSVGHLTTKARAEWAASRQRLLALDAANAEALETIETALFCVCLEDTVPSGTQQACDLMLHGDSANRWFDKALSFIVFADGTAGINCEHCGLDGTTILYLVDAVLTASASEHAVLAGATTQGEPAVAPIELVFDASARGDIAVAGQAFADFAAANATIALSLDFGSDRAKQLGVSPDAFVQVAYQLAHRRTKGLTGATYESIATRQYRNGRTEAMRVVTPEVVRFVDVMSDPGATVDARVAAFRAAAEAHVRRAKECQAGDAPEQHLWELQMIQRRLGGTETLALYDSPGWTIMRDDYLSTSSAPSVNIQHFGFGATSDKCIGVAYALLPDRLNIYLSTPRPVADQMHTFATALALALTDLQSLLT